MDPLLINLGPNTPLERIETLFNETKPDRLYVSSTVVKDPTSAEGDLIKLFALANSHNTLVFLGGRGFGSVRVPEDVPYAFLSTFRELAEK